ncbi:MAG: SIS domain-containing protein [Chloroflexi bacterium]|nr:SIS domain-containing protein [Chloroflexota bacterium]
MKKDPETDFLAQYITEVKEGLDRLDLQSLEKIKEALLSAHAKGSTVFVLGNGGSATTASHFACDLAKGTLEDTDKKRKRFRVVCLADSISLLTAWANDTDYSLVFREQLINLLGPEDVVVAFSTSGNSPNVVRAIEYANELGALTIGFTGSPGGRLGQIAKLRLIVPLESVTKVEDIHILLQHALCLQLRRELSARKG